MAKKQIQSDNVLRIDSGDIYGECINLKAEKSLGKTSDQQHQSFVLFNCFFLVNVSLSFYLLNIIFIPY